MLVGRGQSWLSDYQESLNMAKVKEILIDYINNILKEARKSFKGDELLDLECEIIESHLEKSEPMTDAMLKGKTEITFSDVLSHYTETGCLVLPSVEVMKQMNEKILSGECVDFFEELGKKGDLYDKIVQTIKDKIKT